MEKLIKSTIFLLSLFITVIALLVFSCNQGVTPVQEKSISKPSIKSPSSKSMPGNNKQEVAKQEPVQRKIVEPDFLKDKWVGVNLKITNKKTGDSFIELVPLKKEHHLKQTGLTVKVLHFFPSFLMTGEQITSVSNETKNPAAKVVILEFQNELMNHWMFSRMPQVHGFSHDFWQIELTAGVPAK